VLWSQRIPGQGQRFEGPGIPGMVTFWVGMWGIHK
jgi:hypothetical protein